MLEQGVSAYPGISAWRAGLASALCWIDRRTEAAEILEQARAEHFEDVPAASTWTTTMALYADAASQTGDSRAASILYELLEPWAGQVVWSGPLGYGHIRLWLGLLAVVLGRDGEADQHLRFACDFHEGNDLPVWAARANLGWAEALASRGEAARAQKHAARALELSQEHGYGAFEERATAIVEAQSTA
jgi:hypothetical protein